ncbi:MAG TPA: hypothetical protein VJH67_03475 [Candidatus Paceibacterota bacterium]
MLVIYFFIPAFLVLVILFLSKHREINAGTKTFVGNFLSRFDVSSARIMSLIKYRMYQVVQTVRYLLFVHLPEKSKVKINKTKEAVEERYRKQKDAVMGKKELKQNGSSSFFLHKMSEHKNSADSEVTEGGERGRIEDESIGNLEDKNEKD